MNHLQMLDDWPQRPNRLERPDRADEPERASDRLTRPRPPSTIEGGRFALRPHRGLGGRADPGIATAARLQPPQ